jgi:serine/threonine-protein kinase HipA
LSLDPLVPDGWGRLLLDHTVEKHGLHRGQLNPLDQLAYVGRHGMGALSYEPELDLGNTDDAPLALDKLARESAAVLAGENEEVFEELLRLNGSSSGARPKIVAQVSTDRKAIIHGRQDLQPGFTHWMIKFPSSQGARDVSAIEYAYSLMAKDAGVEMPETHLFRTKRNKYFGTKRFDRNGDARIHMHSLGGLIHADHRSPSLDYDMVLRVSLALTRNIQDAEKAYALVCFNVLAHNRDDHAKNFSFLLNARNEWIFAPAYDLVYSYGPGGEQSMLVLGEGRNPGAVQLQALGKQHGLKNAPEILAKVKRAVANWPCYAEQTEVSRKSTKEIAGKIKLQ